MNTQWRQKLRINLVNQERADSVLRRGIEADTLWAYWAMAQREQNSEGVLTPWHYRSASWGRPEAKAYVDKHSPYTKDQAQEFARIWS